MISIAVADISKAPFQFPADIKHNGYKVCEKIMQSIPSSCLLMCTARKTPGDSLAHLKFIFYDIKIKLVERRQQYFTNLKSGGRKEILGTSIWF